MNEASAKVEWSWSVTSHDVNLSVTFVASGPGAVPIIVEAEALRNADAGTGEGAFVAPAPGTLTLKFNNGHSMLRSKTVRFKIVRSVDTPVAAQPAARAEIKRTTML